MVRELNDMEMIDAHTHLNPDASDPISEYISDLKAAGMNGAVLILNSQDEMDLFWKGEKQLFQSGIDLHIAILLDVHDTNPFMDSVRKAKEKGIPFSVKLHSRISDITEKDFSHIDDCLENICFRSIIVDSFLYGSKKENTCYIELSTFLAEKYPEKNIIMAHFGGIKVLETMLRTRQLKNVFYDCSFTMDYLRDTSVWKDLRHCIKYNTDRVLFGSDMPWFKPLISKETLYALLEGETGDVIEDIFSKNARRLYFD